jgi:predicted DNA-binding transcriptional regulator AlpA
MSDSNSNDRNLTVRQVRERYQICSRTVARWIRDPDLSFPQPLVINGRHYFPEAALIAWERSQVRERAA